jgi:hypothetical protein
LPHTLFFDHPPTRVFRGEEVSRNATEVGTTQRLASILLHHVILALVARIFDQQDRFVAGPEFQRLGIVMKRTNWTNRTARHPACVGASLCTHL